MPVEASSGFGGAAAGDSGAAEGVGGGEDFGRAARVGDGGLGGGFGGGLEGVFEAFAGVLDVLFGLVEADVFAVEEDGGDAGGAGAVEGVEDGVAGVGGGFDDAIEDSDGHLAAVPAFAFFEGAAESGDVPGVEGGCEVAGFDGFLGAEVPGVVGEFAFGVGAGVAVGGLAGAGDADGVGVEGEVFGVFGEVEDVGVGAGELGFGLLAEGVVPDDPVAHGEADFFGDDSEFGGVVIAYGEVEGAGGFEGAMDGGHPGFGEVEVVVGFFLVVVAVVEVADVEGGIGEDEVDPAGGFGVEEVNGVAGDDLVFVGHAGGIVALWAEGTNLGAAG